MSAKPRKHMQQMASSAQRNWGRARARARARARVRIRVRVRVWVWVRG